jgi:hypothetical protein
MMYHGIHGDIDRAASIARALLTGTACLPKGAQIAGNAANVLLRAGARSEALEVFRRLASEHEWRSMNIVTSAHCACRLIELAAYGDLSIDIRPHLATLAQASSVFRGSRRGETFDFALAQGNLLSGEIGGCRRWLEGGRSTPADRTDVLRTGFRAAIEIELSLATGERPDCELVDTSLAMLSASSPRHRRDYLAAAAIKALTAHGRHYDARQICARYREALEQNGWGPTPYFLSAEAAILH